MGPRRMLWMGMGAEKDREHPDRVSKRTENAYGTEVKSSIKVT